MIRFIRNLIHKEIHGHSTPEELARGTAIGLFVALTPFFGLQVLVSLALAWLFRGNKALAMAMAFVTNPWTMLPIYYAEGRVAEIVIPYEQNIFNRQAVTELFLDHEPETTTLERMRIILVGKQSREYFKRILAGSVIIGLPLSVIAYVVVWRVSIRIQRQKRNRKKT